MTSTGEFVTCVCLSLLVITCPVGHDEIACVHVGKMDVWVADLKNGTGSVSHGPSDAKVDTTLKMAEDDFVALAAGKLNAMQAFMKGKLKISGNMMLAQKLQGIFQRSSL
jgi:putative sterol carrier protein